MKDGKELRINVTKHIVWSGMTLVGTLFMAVGFSVFLVPNNIAAGGFSGLAFIFTQIIEKLTGGVQIPNGVIYILLNIPLFIISAKNLGKSFLFLGILGTFSFSYFMEVVHMSIVIDDAFLAALYGGILYGIGLGIVVRGNSSTGGTDMLGLLLNKVNYRITVGGFVVFFDIFVLALNAIFNGYLTAMYGMVSIFISGLICDYITEGPRAIKAVYIISEKYQEISEKIICDLHRGVTGIDGEGMFYGNKKKILLTLVARRQMDELNSIVFSIDENAFTFSTNCKDAVGNGFNKPNSHKKSSDIYKMLSGDKMEKIEKVSLPKRKCECEDKDTKN